MGNKRSKKITYNHLLQLVGDKLLFNILKQSVLFVANIDCKHCLQTLATNIG